MLGGKVGPANAGRLDAFGFDVGVVNEAVFAPLNKARPTTLIPTTGTVNPR